MARWIISGKSANSLAKYLNQRGIRTGQGKLWRTQQIGPFLRSPRLRGYVIEGPRGRATLVRGADGMPVRRTPIIDDETWTALQAALDRNADKKSAVHTRASGLLGVAFCALCGRKLHADVRSARPSHAYYVCYGRLEEGCVARSLPMSSLETLGEGLFLAMVGPVEVLERIAVPGDDHATALAEVGQAIADLTQERYVRGIVRDNYDQTLAGLQAEHARISALPPEPPTITERSTGRTFAQLWDGASIEERRQLMMKAGFKLWIARTRNADTITDRKKLAEVRGQQEAALATMLLSVGVTEVSEQAWDEVRALLNPNMQMAISFELDPDLARRAGLAASGQSVIVPEADPESQHGLAAARALMGRPALTAVADDSDA